MTLWLINGYTKEVGLWEVELFTYEKEAMDEFDYYVKEYNATIVDRCNTGAVALCGDDIGSFYIEKREV